MESGRKTSFVSYLLFLSKEMIFGNYGTPYHFNDILSNHMMYIAVLSSDTY